MLSTRTSLTLIALLTACGGQKGGLTVFNTPPSVTIVSPPDGTQLQEGETVTFEARVDDAENDDGELEIRWSSDLGGEFPGPFLLEGGVTTLTTASLDGGFNHVITVTAIDPSAEADSASITVTVEDLPDAPSIEMARPIDGETGVEGVAFTFSALVSDPKEEASALTVTFSTDQAEGAFCTPEVDAAGEARCEAVLGIGAHVLTFLVEDGEGFSDEVSRVFTVRGRDGDGDGFEGEEWGGPDCDDDDPSVFPGASEVCNDADEDCDGIIDEETVCSDDDLDGYTEAEGDCDDSVPASYPLAPEIEDGYDNNCNGVIDEGTPAYDDDGDGYSERAGDCNDSLAAINPAAVEVCDGVNNDCDAEVDEQNASGCTNYFYDYDGDGFGTTTSACVCGPTGYYTSAYSNDCYDYNASASPSALAWQVNQRGDSSFDYNCDGAQERQVTQTGSCGSWPGCGADPQGWNGGVPGCGSTGPWLTDCSINWFSCNASTETRQQSCR
jgi:hypothetical protein